MGLLKRVGLSAAAAIMAGNVVFSSANQVPIPAVSEPKEASLPRQFIDWSERYSIKNPKTGIEDVISDHGLEITIRSRIYNQAYGIRMLLGDKILYQIRHNGGPGKIVICH